MRLFILCLVCASLTAKVSHVEASEPTKRQWIRFYEANRMLQTNRIQFTRKNGRLLGCHNFLKKARVYKLLIYGFGHCEIYSEKDCAKDSQLEALREQDTLATLKLPAGYGWYPRSEHARGEKIHSWSCSNEPVERLPKRKMTEEALAAEKLENERQARARAKVLAQKKAAAERERKNAKKQKQKGKNKAKKMKDKDKLPAE